MYCSTESRSLGSMLCSAGGGPEGCFLGSGFWVFNFFVGLVSALPGVEGLSRFGCVKALDALPSEDGFLSKRLGLRVDDPRVGTVGLSSLEDISSRNSDERAAGRGHC